MVTKRYCVAVALMIGGNSHTCAQVVVVPNIFATAPGGAGSLSLIGTQNNPWTVQLLWNENQLTGLVGSQITSLRYRLNSVIPNGYPLSTTTWADYRISLGSSVAPNQATGTYASNFTTTPTLVRSGPFTVQPFAWPAGPGGGMTAPWGAEITFDTPYVYTGGHLAILITHPGSNNPDFGNALLESTSTSAPGNGINVNRISSNDFNGLTGAQSVFSGVIQLNATPIPEPTSLALAVVAVFPAIAWRRRRAEPSRLKM